MVMASKLTTLRDHRSTGKVTRAQATVPTNGSTTTMSSALHAQLPTVFHATTQMELMELTKMVSSGSTTMSKMLLLKKTLTCSR